MTDETIPTTDPAATPRRAGPGDPVPGLRGPAPAAATAAAMVALGHGVAFAAAAHAHGLASAIAGHLGLASTAGAPSVALALLGGLAIGMPLAAQVLHREHAQPLDRAADGARYAYTRQGRRRMAAGLAAGYATAATLAVAIAGSTSATAELRALLAY
jgi:hypothetical protein